MNFYTISTFRNVIVSLTKKAREGYTTIVTDVCTELQSMPINILRDSNERIIQTAEYRIVKLRIGNSGQKLSKSNGFRLIYFVSLHSDDVVLMTVFPKRGAKGVNNIPNAEYVRLLKELWEEDKAQQLQVVDITNDFAELGIGRLGESKSQR